MSVLQRTSKSFGNKPKREQVPEYVSDAIVSLLSDLGVEYVAINPGATFRGIHDSLVNFNGNKNPELILCTHEEIAVAMACGYARATGKLGVAIVHNIVGLQHATRAIYDAWLERLPVLILGGTGPVDSMKRRPGIDWIHTALVQGNLVRDYVKWDDQPEGETSALESLIRASQISQSEPEGPTYICFDITLQESRLSSDFQMIRSDRFKQRDPLPQANPDELRAAAKALVESSSPVIIADYFAKSQKDVDTLVSLSDLLVAPVIDLGGRFNFPNTHLLDLTGAKRDLLKDCDTILALDTYDLYGAIVQEKSHFAREIEELVNKDTKVINAGMSAYRIGSWAQSYQRLVRIDIDLVGSTRIILPELVSRCRKLISERSEHGSRSKRMIALSNRHKKLREEWNKSAQKGRNSRPISVPYLASCIWSSVKEKDWILTYGTFDGWARKLWDWSKYYQYAGKGQGTGTGVGGALGVALSYRHSDHLCIDLQPDGDLLYTASTLWTAKHHNIPMLIVMLNNRSYFNDEKHQEFMAVSRGRPVKNKTVGIALDNPATDFSKLAQSFGLYGEGPIEDPRDICPALEKAIEVIQKERRAALVDIVTQPR